MTRSCRAIIILLLSLSNRILLLLFKMSDTFPRFHLIEFDRTLHCNTCNCCSKKILDPDQAGDNMNWPNTASNKNRSQYHDNENTSLGPLSRQSRSTYSRPTFILISSNAPSQLRKSKSPSRSSRPQRTRARRHQILRVHRFISLAQQR